MAGIIDGEAYRESYQSSYPFMEEYVYRNHSLLSRSFDEKSGLLELLLVSPLFGLRHSSVYPIFIPDDSNTSGNVDLVSKLMT